jgi:uncharacterized membrane protein
VGATTSRQSKAALLLGLAVGLRAFSAPAALALRARHLNAPRRAVLLGAAGELIADKLPSTPSRLSRRGLRGRLVSGAISGQLVAGRAGALTSAAAALVSAFAGHAFRTRAPGWRAAVCEDATAIALASAGAARSQRVSQLTP